MPSLHAGNVMNEQKDPDPEGYRQGTAGPTELQPRAGQATPAGTRVKLHYRGKKRRWLTKCAAGYGHLGTPPDVPPQLMYPAPPYCGCCCRESEEIFSGMIWGFRKELTLGHA